MSPKIHFVGTSGSYSERPSRRLEEAFERPPVFGGVSERVSRQQPHGVHVCSGVRTAQRTPRPESSCSIQCLNRKMVAVDGEDLM
jgi:hypothetical protein